MDDLTCVEKNNETCLVGWWCDGYEFEPIYDGDEIHKNSTDESECIRLFDYCPDCGRKL